MSVNTRFSIRQIFFTDYLFLFGVTFFIRFPFFFRDYIDRDESTFILIGKSITDGYLPYDYLWDLKPPLLFYVFGLIQYIFPLSLIAIRFFGVIIIFLSAIFLLQITKTLQVKNGYLIALSYVILSSLFGSIQGVMSEHLAIFFFLPGLLLFLKNKVSFQFFMAGFFFGCALMCKLNLAYPVLALMMYYIIFYYKEHGIFHLLKNTSLISAGLFMPIILIAVPYILKGKLKLFIDSVFMATLEYGHTTKVSVWYKLSVAWWLIAIGLLISFLAIKFAAQGSKKTAGLLAVILMATIFTFYSSGTVNGHYLIQVYPIASLLLLGFVFSKSLMSGYLKYSLLVLLVSAESYLEYYKIAKQYAATSAFYNGKAFRTIEELKKRKLENKKIFFGDYHIGYWFLNTYPLAKSVTHPSSLSRPAFFKHFGNNRNAIEELMNIMEEIKPEVIVSRRENLSFFLENSLENLYFTARLKKYYNLIYCSPGEKIYIWQQNGN